MESSVRRPLRILFLCTANSGRSQIAEALLSVKRADRFVVASAGSHPASEVNPLTIRALAELGIDWSGKLPKGIDSVGRADWDFVITLCDRAKESCPALPGKPVYAHWGMPDPAAVVGSEEDCLAAFRETIQYLSRRINLMLALPFEKLERAALEQRIGALGIQTELDHSDSQR